MVMNRRLKTSNCMPNLPHTEEYNTCVLVHAHPLHTPMHTHTYTHTHTLTHIKHASTHACEHAHTEHTHIICTHAHMHTYKTHIHTHKTRTHAHTHTQSKQKQGLR